MSLSTITKNTSTSPTQKLRIVYEYWFTVTNSQDNDTQELTAAFTSIPTPADWQQWLMGWNSCGYSLDSQPILIHII